MGESSNLSEMVFGHGNLRIEIRRGTEDEVLDMAPEVPAGWERLGMRLEACGDGSEVVATYVDQRVFRVAAR
jgi:hypothetical protein